MKIYILPTQKILQPSSQSITYPKHNKDFGVEQDFFKYLTCNTKLLTSNPLKANWHYLPVYWTRWHLNHDYGKKGKNELQARVDNLIIEPKKTFTICQYDDGPVISLPEVSLFLASRKTSHGTDIPLLSSPHQKPLIKPRKQIIASFIGRLSTHNIRNDMNKLLSKKSSILILDGNFGVRKYTNTMLKSYVALSPRGYGGSSFRFFEAMQLGIAPFLIGDLDTRPFKKFINWEEISFYSKNVDQIMTILTKYSKPQLLEMGKKASKIWSDQLNYQKWCGLVIKQLEERL